ncbi:glycosyltransferase family 92 protein F13G3.3-like [Pelodytes ibericus]
MSNSPVTDQGDRIISTSSITALGDNQTFILSPYYDLRKKPAIVRVIAIIHHSVTDLYCWFHCTHNSSIMVKAQIDLHKDRFGFAYGTADLLCTEPPLCDYHYISVHWSQIRNRTELPWFEIKNRPPQEFSVNFTVCISTMYGDYKNVLQTIQSIEMYKLLGADRVTIYVNKCHESVDKVLQYYKNEGILEVVPWPIDKFLRTSKKWHYTANSTSQVGYYGQTATLNDCVYRNMYRSKFVMLNDIDEIILPLEHQDWGSLMQTLQRDHPQANVFLFENHVFRGFSNGPEWYMWKNITGINILPYVYREPFHIRMISARKLIINPRKVYQTSIHVAAKFDGKSARVRNKTAIVFHAKERKQPFALKTLIEDKAICRFNASLTQKVNKVIENILLKC